MDTITYILYSKVAKNWKTNCNCKTFVILIISLRKLNIAPLLMLNVALVAEFEPQQRGFNLLGVFFSCLKKFICYDSQENIVQWDFFRKFCFPTRQPPKTLGTSGRRCSLSPFKWWAGIDVSGLYFHNYFLPFSPFFNPSVI